MMKKKVDGLGRTQRGDVIPVPPGCVEPPPIADGKWWTVARTETGTVTPIQYRAADGTMRIEVRRAASDTRVEMRGADGTITRVKAVPAPFLAQMSASMLGFDVWMPVAHEFKTRIRTTNKPAWLVRPLFGPYLFIAVGQGDADRLRRVACLTGLVTVDGTPARLSLKGMALAHAAQMAQREQAIARVSGVPMTPDGDVVGAGDVVDAGDAGVVLRVLVTAVGGERDVEGRTSNGWRARIGLARMRKVA